MKSIIIKISLALLVLAIVVIPTGYWIQHPELTKMQIFIEFWWLYVPGVLLSIVVSYFNNR